MHSCELHFPAFRRTVGVAFSPMSTKRRRASERDGLSACRAAHASIAAIFSSGRRNDSSGSCPVGGRPIFFGLLFLVDDCTVYVYIKGGESGFGARTCELARFPR